MRLTILTLAHDVYFSEPGNLLNLTGIYTGLTSPTFPFTVPKLLLIARFTGSPAEYGRDFEIIVNLVDQNGLPGPIPSDRQLLHMTTGQSGEDVHCVYRLEAFDTTFTQAGWYQFFVHVDGAIIDELPVNVSQSVRRSDG
ncbi:MAG: hypothetical protein ABI835_20125 [Chloroflexota bacterium]